MRRGSASAGGILYDVEIQKRVLASGAVRWRVRWRQGERHRSQTFDRKGDAVTFAAEIRRRQQLVEIAREYDALIITDDVYDFLQWRCTVDVPQESSIDSAILPRIVDIDRQLDGGPDRPGADGFGNAVSNGSFSKIVGPGCRVGWAEGTEKFAYGLSQW